MSGGANIMHSPAVHIVAGARLLLLLLSAYRPCSCTHPYRTRPAIRKLSSDDLYTIYNGRRDGDEYDGILYCLSDAIVS